MVPSLRAYQFLLVGTIAGLAIACFDNDSTRPALLGLGLATSLIIDLGVIVLLIIDSLRVKSQRATVTRANNERLSIGRNNPIHLTATSGDKPAVLQICDYFPAAFQATPEKLEITLPANTTQELTYKVFPDKRGEYDWQKLQVRQLGAWGLAWHNWTVPQPQTVAVYPDLIGLRSLTIKLTLQTTGNLRQAKRLGMGTEFAELREYGSGDDLRLVDWKATARRSRLLVRVLEPEQEQTLIILLDRGRLMTAQVNGLARFDWGMNAALSLALAGLHRGDRVGLGVFDREMQTWIPPERGQSHLSKLIERLTPIEPVIMEPDYLNAVTKVTQQQTRRALVVLITDVIDKTASSELLMAMARLTPRYLPFCVALRDPKIDRQAQQQTESVTGAYERAVALDLIAQRQVALGTLRQKGVMILDAPADQITDQLVDRYLQMKARSQI
jgi:uncharacterized protein (DUF58 family)